MRALRFQISMFLTGRLASCFGLEKIFQMMAWRVMAHAVADSFWGKGSIRTLPALNQQSVSLDILMASSISIPKYLMVLSIFV